MWSDKHRGIRIGLCLAVLLGLGWMYTGFMLDRPVGVRAAIAEPEAHEGQSLLLPLWWVSSIDGPTQYAVSKTMADVPVQGPTAGLSLGDTVSIKGVFQAPNQVIEEERHLHWLRPWKGGFSLLGLLLGAFLLPRCFGWRNGRVVPRG